MVEFVLAERAGGTRRFQLKVGADAETDVARVRAVVEATGEGDTIVADANGGWRLAEAVQVVGMLEGTPRLRIEHPDDLDSFGQVVGMLEGTPRLRIEQPCRSFEE